MQVHRNGTGRRRALFGGLPRLKLAHVIAFAVIWSVLFAHALTLPAAFLSWDRQFRDRIEQDVRRVLMVVAEPQAFPRAVDLVRRGQALVERGALLGGVIYDVAGNEVGAFGERPGLTPAEAVAEGVTRRADRDRAVVDLYLPPQETGLVYGLVASVSLAGLPDAAAAHLRQIVEFGLAVAVAGTLLAVGLLWIWIIRPLKRLREATVAAVHDPDTADRHRLGWSRGDELGETSRALDLLLSAVSVVYQEDLAAAHQAIARSAVATVQYDAAGRPMAANPAALALFAADSLEDFQRLDPRWIRVPSDDGGRQISVLELADDTDQMRLRTIQTRQGDRRCLVGVLTMRRSDGTVHRHIASLVDLTTQYDYARRLETNVDALKRENDDLTRGSIELRQMFESCMALLESTQGRAATQPRKAAAPAIVNVDQIVGSWFAESTRAGLVNARMNIAVLPPVYAPVAPVRVVFRQALLLACLCSRETQPILSVSGEAVNGMAVFTLAETRKGAGGEPPRTSNWTLPFSALRAVLADASGKLIEFTHGETVLLRFALPAAPAELVSPTARLLEARGRS